MSEAHMDPNRPGLFLPVLLILITLVIWFGFQTYQVVKERENLKTLQANQETMFNNAQKMRAQMDAIAAETARLAQQGNANAAQVVNALKARGITINPNATPGKQTLP